MQLIAAAPAVARGARELWAGVRKKPEPGTSAGDRLEGLEAQVGELKKELAASADVIKAMAEQNERLLEAVGILRARVRVALALSTASIALAVVMGVRLAG
jgi:hypothetical protein